MTIQRILWEEFDRLEKEHGEAVQRGDFEEAAITCAQMRLLNHIDKRIHEEVE